MSPWQRKLRKALGSVKDQTTIGLAKVAGAMAPELEVALVKATSHDKAPFEEKHVREVIFLISTSRAYTMACVSHLSRRLSRTQNWIVAVKALMLIHRLLRQGDPAFEEELLRESRAGSHLLNLSGFRDDSITYGWEYSAFVRTYALFLDELLDYNASIRAFSTDAGRPSSSSNSSFGRRSGSDAYGYMYEEHGSGCLAAFKDMKPHELLERMPLVQRMLERVLACHPAGTAKMDQLVQIALDLVVKDSFQFYDSICDGLAIIMDAFFEMESTDCTKAFEIQTVAAKQADALNTFYGSCKSVCGCPSSEYPFVQKIAEEILETMEGFLRNIMMREKQDRGSKELKKQKALPVPPLPQAISAATHVLNVQEQPMTPSLLDISHDAPAAEDHGQSSALTPSADPDVFAWQAFDKGELSHTFGTELVKEKSANAWEVALFASTNQTPMPGSFVMAEGFDGSLVGRLHEQAIHQQRLALSVPLSIAASLTLPGNPSSLLALPAPETTSGEDPFVASYSIPPPAYVQMSDMKQKQELLLQEQRLWDEYQRDGMQGQNGLAKIYNRGLNCALQSYFSASLLH